MPWSVPTSLQTVFTGADLQNLVADTPKRVQYDNSSAKDELGDFVFALKYDVGALPTAGDLVADIYMAPVVDGSNDPSEGGTPSVPQGLLPIASLETRNPSTTVLEYLSVIGIKLPPTKIDFWFVTSSTAATANDTSSSGKLQPYNP